jgi:hypothetical protein
MNTHATRNQPSEAELLAKAKTGIEEGERSLRESAEALATTWELHKTPQRKMAEAVGKSQPWVCRLLQWRRDGYKGDSPFGPTTKAGRDKHDNQNNLLKWAKRAAHHADTYLENPDEHPADAETLAAAKAAADAWQKVHQNLQKRVVPSVMRTRSTSEQDGAGQSIKTTTRGALTCRESGQ